MILMTIEGTSSCLISCTSNIWKKCILKALTLAVFFIPQASGNTAKLTNKIKVATSYLQKIAAGNINLLQDSAISEHCSLLRRKAIQEQLNFLRQTHFNEGDSFKFEDIQTSGEFAAILLKSENSRSPLSTRIHALALVRRDDTWRAAPLPGSFTNTGYGYDADIEKSVRSLENWMAREQVTRESLIRQNAKDNLLESILKQESKTKLTNRTPEQIALSMIEQCRNKNLLGILAHMGTTSQQQSESLDILIETISQGLLSSSSNNDWQLVTNPSVIIQPMDAAKSKETIIGFWNPLSEERTHILHFPTHQDKITDKTFVSLPHQLKIAMLPEQERWRNRWQAPRGDEKKLKEKIPEAIFKHYPPQSFPNDNKKISNQFITALDEQNFSACVPLIPRQGEFFGSAANQLKTLNHLSTLWALLSRLQDSPRRNLTVITRDKLALLPLQFAKVNRPGESQIIRVWFIKENDGWHLIPEEILNEYADKDLKDTHKKIKTELRAIEKEQQERLSRSLMNQVITLTPPLKLEPINDKAAEKALSDYRSLLRSKKTASALGRCAIIEGTSHAQTLKTFNYALRGAADHSEPDHQLGSKLAGNWLGISLRTESKTSGATDYPLYLIINTTEGTKILLDIDLRYATNKGRTLLNKRNWSKLEKALPKEDLTHIQAIFTNHKQLASEDLAANEQPQQ